MNQDNGGIIGKLNTPTTTVASGVWTLQDQFEAQTSSIWPLAFPQTTIANSCRFDRNSGASLSRTESTTQSDGKKITISVWCKLGSQLSSTRYFFGTSADGSYSNEIGFTSNDQLNFSCINNAQNQVTTTRVFRDPSAWYHIVGVLDSTQGTSTNRIKLYVNGVEETSFASSSYPSENAVTEYLKNGGTTEVGDKGSGGNNFDGYLTEINIIDGQALTPTSFGAFNPVTNIWEPRGYAGTYGNNGFRLDFADASNLGNDANGGTDLTENNLASTDQSTDTCSNNFTTLNPLHFGIGSISNTALSEGNLKFVSTEGGSAYPYYCSTMAVSQGKWYTEFKYVSSDSGTAGIGNGIRDQYAGNNAYDYSYYFDGRLYNSGSGESTGYSAISNNDILGCALDLDNNKIYFHINGSYQASGDPANNTGGKSITAAASNGTGVYHFVIGDSGANQPTIECNFGSPSFSISSGNADANGFGNFEYAVPSGYYALNTSNLNTYG